MAGKARPPEVSQVAAPGSVYITTPALHELMRREIPVTRRSFGGWFPGHTAGTGHKNVELRTAQLKAGLFTPGSGVMPPKLAGRYVTGRRVS